MYTAMRGLKVAYTKMAIAGGITPRSGPLLFKPSTVPTPIYHLWKTNSFNIGQAMIKPVLGSKLICSSLRSNDHPRLSYGGDFDDEPFWKTMVKDIAWTLKSVAVFLVEQPSQIKYIEWPTFQNTLRTAMLTLVLVAVLIVALSSVDSCLSYILALLLRRAA